MIWLSAAAAVALAIWLGLLFGRDGFWWAAPGLEALVARPPTTWPAVLAVVPARNEAGTITAALGSLLAQDYPGDLRIVLVDDQSEDGTGAIAARLAATSPRLEVVRAGPLPAGWSGKLWAIDEGLRHAGGADGGHVLLTDADIVHGPATVRRLVALAQSERLDLVSLMVQLHCEGFWERLLIPPFVFFFQKLYPFPAVADPARRTAAAAGACILVRRAALDAAGGIEAISGALIDDVALARAIKHRPGGGRLWLGLTTDSVSLRQYRRLAQVWNMVARTADTQLGHSLVALLGTVLAMVVAYLAPPLALVVGSASGEATLAVLGLAGVGCMLVAYRPTAQAYGLAWYWWLTLPVAATLYAAMTVDSAIRYRRGVGGRWKGRSYPRG